MGSSVDSQMSCLWPRLKFDRCSVAAVTHIDIDIEIVMEIEIEIAVDVDVGVDIVQVVFRSTHNDMLGNFLL